MSVPVTMTITVADNPLTGLPGQNDVTVTVTVSGEPDVPLADVNIYDPDTVPEPLQSSTAFWCAFAMLHALSQQVGSVDLIRVWLGGHQ